MAGKTNLGTPDPTSKEGLLRLEQLADAATPGPWGYDSYRTLVSIDKAHEVNEVVEAVPDGATDEQWEEARKAVPQHKIATFHGGDEFIPDAKFVEAAQPSVVKALISRIRELEVEVEAESREAQGWGEEI